MTKKQKEKRKHDLIDLAVSMLREDAPWTVTPYMEEQRIARQNASSYNYGYNHATGKVERIY